MAIGRKESDSSRRVIAETGEEEAAPLVQYVDRYAGAMARARQTALHFGEIGVVSRREALVAAECYARLAAAVGTDQDRRELVDILLAHADRLAAANLPHSALRREACEHLITLTNGGDDRAAELLDLLRQEADLPETLPPEVLASIAGTLAMAAQGHTPALLGMADAAMTMIDCGAPRDEALIQAEQYTRLGYLTGCPTSAIALACVLILRWDSGESAEHALEAFGVLLPLADRSEHAAQLLATTLTDPAPAELPYFVSRYPALLAYCNPEGNA